MQFSRVVVVVLSVLALALLNGCGGEPAATPAPADSSSPTPSEGEASPEETDSASGPAVEPASGKPMVLDNIRARAPQGWSVADEGLGLLTAQEPDAFGQLFLSDFGTVGATTPQEFLQTIGMDEFRGKPQVSFDAELGGAPAYRAVGRGSLGRLVVYGAVRDGVGSRVTFSFLASWPANQQRRIEESVVASFEWR